MNTEKIRHLTHFQHWLGTNYNTLPTDSQIMTNRAILFLKETQPAIKNENCNIGFTWETCSEHFDHCNECPNHKK